jgi:hypothetical protein
MIRKSHIRTTGAACRSGVTKLLGAALVSAAALAPAHADVIDFEGYTGLVGHNEYIEHGVLGIAFVSPSATAAAGDLVGAFIDGSDPTSCIGGSCPVNNPSTYYSALDDGYLDLFTQAGATLSIKSFDASFIGGTAPGTTYPAVPGLVRIQGWFADGSSVFETYQLGGPVNNAFSFGHYNTSAAFSNFKFVEAAIFGFACNTAGNCSAFSTDRGQFGIDNIQVAVVPEPATALLVGLGMVGLIARSRRRNA